MARSEEYSSEDGTGGTGGWRSSPCSGEEAAEASLSASDSRAFVSGALQSSLPLPVGASPHRLPVHFLMICAAGSAVVATRKHTDPMRKSGAAQGLYMDGMKRKEPTTNSIAPMMYPIRTVVSVQKLTYEGMLERRHLVGFLERWSKREDLAAVGVVPKVRQLAPAAQLERSFEVVQRGEDEDD